ncbi:MAG: BTAD domain-containing putative transcriptional regulator, partial [Gemmatimonadaceae bacterium]
ALRQSVGNEVIRTRGDAEVSIDPATLSTDLAVVWQALHERRIEDALGAYGGDLLPGLYPADSEGFQRWLDAERARIKSSITAAATQRVRELKSEGSNERALTIARRLMEIEPDDETLVRQVMSLQESVGDKVGAFAVFDAYRARLATEFDAEPAAETAAITDRLRQSTSGAPQLTRRVRREQVVPESTKPAPIPPTLTEPQETPPGVRPTPNSRLPLAVLGSVAAAVMIAVVGWTLSRPEQPMAVGDSGPLTSDEGLQVQAAISPNGRLVAYAKGHTSSLRIFVQKIGGGAAWPLSPDSVGFQIKPRWAPDNDQILFLSRANAYVSPSIGGAPVLVARGTVGDGMIRSATWSPTGDSVAIVRNDSLMVIPLHGPGSRFVGSGNQLHSCVWSPDGSRIACVSGNWVSFEAGPLFGNEAPSSIVVFKAAGGAPVDVTGAKYQNRNPAWSSDGHFLWMLSDRGGAGGEVFSVALGDNDLPSSPYARAGITAESIDISSSRIAYSVPVRKANIWSVALPADHALSLADARRVTTGTQLIELLSVSPDGKWIVFDSNLYGNADVFRMPVDGGPSERLTDDPRPEYMGGLSPDGRELALHRYVEGRRHVFVRNLEAGTEVEVNSSDPADNGGPRWSPDGNSLAIWKHIMERGETFVVSRDANGNWKSPRWKLAGGQLPVWSPDGRTLAMVRYDGGIDLIPADSGAQQHIYVRRPHSTDPIVSNLVWNLGPGTIWFIGSNESGHGGIWSVSARGGTLRLRVDLDDPSGRLHGPSLASDGKKFFFTIDERFSNMRWAELNRR